MKKILAVVCIFAALFSFASCKRRLTPEEEDASRAVARSIALAEYESKVAASIKNEENIVEDKAKTLEELGKTEKGKQIVFHNTSGYTQYEVITMDKDGKAETWERYVYYPNTDSYNVAMKDKDTRKFAIIDSDEELRLVVYKNMNEKGFKGIDYETILKNIKDFGYTIVE